ncbi:MAG: hypothetical protein ACTHKG_07400 [Nocardioides sp.]
MSLSNDSRAQRTAVPASPPATRHRAAVWKDPRLVVGVALVAVSALLGAVVLGGGRATSTVWAARAALVEGQTLAAEDLVRREVRFADPADRDRYLSAEQPLPRGVLARDVGAGELLPVAALGTGSAQEVVEVPLAVPADAVPATVRTGSVVDVWVTPDPALDAGAGAQEVAQSALVFGRVRVLEVSRGGGALGPRTTWQVMVGLTPAQEKALPEALARLARGSAVLVRRP